MKQSVKAYNGKVWGTCLIKGKVLAWSLKGSREWLKPTRLGAGLRMVVEQHEKFKRGWVSVEIVMQGGGLNVCHLL